MAKPLTPAEEAALRKAYNIPATESIDDVASMTSAATLAELVKRNAPVVTPPAVPKPVKPTPVRATAPTITPPAPAPTPTVTPSAAPISAPLRVVGPDGKPFKLEGLPAVVQTETGRMGVRTRGASTGKEELEAARLAKEESIGEAAAGLETAPTTRLTPKAERFLKDRVKTMETAPRTPAGERRTLTPSSAVIEDVFSSVGLPNVGRVAGAIAPQVIVNEQQAKDLKARKDRAYQEAQAFFNGRPDNLRTKENFTKVYEAYYYGGIPDVMGPLTEDGKPPTILGSRGAAKVAERLFTSTTPTGAIIESPITTVGKALSAGEAVLTAGAKKAGEELGRATLSEEDKRNAPPTKSYMDTLVEDVKEGQGLLAGSEAMRETGRLFGASEDTQDLLGAVGGVLGFVGGVAVPLDLGIGSVVSTSAKAGKGAAQVAKAFNAPTAAVVAAGARGAARGAAEGLFDAYKIMTPKTGGGAAISSELAASTKRFLESPRLNAVSDVTLQLAANKAVQDAIIADRALGQASVDSSIPVNRRPAYDSQPLQDVLRTEYEKLTGRTDFDDYVKAAESYGIDFTNTAGKRAASSTPPPNVRIKEVEEGLRKTASGVDTTHYFDEIATGGRSDIYYNALLDNLSPAAKADLMAGKAIKRVDLESAVDTFINEVRFADTTVDGGLTVATAIALDKELASRGINLGVKRILGEMKLPAGVTAASKGAGAFILPQTGPAYEAVKKAFNIDTARKFVNNFSGKTGIVGRQVKIGAITLSAEEGKALLNDVAKKNPWIKEIGDRFRKGKTGTVELTPAEVRALNQKFIDEYVTGLDRRGMARVASDVGASVYGRAGREKVVTAMEVSGGPLALKPTEFYSPYQTVTPIQRLNKQLDETGTAILSSDQFNELVRGAIAIEAGSKVTAKTDVTLGGIASRLAGENKGAELSYFTREVFKPKDFSEAGIGAMFVDNVRRFTEPTSKDPIVKGIVADVNARMGSLSDTFKARMRAEMGETQIPGANIAAEGARQVGVKTKGVSRPEAFANVVTKEFTEGPVFRPTRGSKTRAGGFEVLRGQPRTPDEILEATQAGAYEMFRTNMAAMFGGYERTIDSIATTGRIVDLDNAAVSTAETRNLVTVLMETPAVKPYVDAFVSAVEAGDNVKAINALQRMHIDFYGYSIEQILTRKGNVAVRDIQDTLKMASETVARKPYGADIIDYYTSTGGLRSIDETYRAASQQAMVIKPENFKEMLTGTYFTKAQANALDEVLTTAQQRHPELFPSASTLQDMATSDFQTVKNGIVRGLELKARDLDAVGDTATSGFIRDNIIPWMEGKGGLLVGTTGREADNLLIAAIEDQVATMSSTTGKGKAYIKELVSDYKASTGGTTADLIKAKGILKGVIEDNNIIPGSVYRELYGTNARADATVLFYQTALTDIKNQLKAPLAGSLQGIAEKTATIPLLTKTAGGLKKPIQAAGNLKSITETMEGIKLATTSNKLDQVVAKNGQQVAKDIADLETVISRFLTDEISAEEKALAKVKEQTIAGKPLQITDDVAGSYAYYRKVALETLLDGTSDIAASASGIAKNGLLGGLALPNIIYMMGNQLTGASIVASQVGLGKGLYTANPLLNWKVGQAMQQVYAPAWSKIDRVLITATDGTIYTASDIAKIISEGGIGRSQASAELTNQLINGAIDWAGRTKLYGDKNLAGKAIRRNFVNYNDMNVWSSLANSVDQWYRTGVLMRALEEGEQLPQALKLARESLFDYGNLSQFEKDVVSKVFWFWTFRRNNWRSLAVSMLMDPRKLKVAFAQRQGWSYAYQLGKQVFGSEEEDLDYKYAMKEYSENRMFLNLIEDPENKKRYGIYGPPIPQTQAVGELIDYLSIPVAYAAGSAGLTGEPTSLFGSVSDVADLIVQQSNPYIQGIAAATVGLDLRTGRSIGDYLDPKLVWYIRQNPTIEQTFNTYVQIEAVPFEEEVAGRGYYQGRQWRIKKDDRTSQKNWAMFKSLLLTAGVGRTISDYAPLAQSLSPLEGYTPEAAMETDFWRTAGVVTAQDAPTIEEIQRQNRLRAASEIREISPTEAPAENRYKKE